MMTNMVKTSLLSLKIAVTSLLLLTSINALAARCIDVFPTVLSSSSNGGKSVFEREVVLSGTNGSIDIRIQSDATTDRNPSCVSQKCIDSNKRSEAFSLPSFKTSNSNQDYTVNNGDTLSLPQGSYDQINVNYQAAVQFTQHNEVTFINTLNASSETTLTFEEGVYWIDNFNISYKTKIVINGNDKVTLIINKYRNRLNNLQSPTEVSFNVNGTPNQLVLIAYSSVYFGYKTNLKGFIYASKKIELASENIFEGAINGGNIKLKYSAGITYAPDSIESANFNGFCSVDALPVLEYRFDEVSWNGTPGEVLDNFSRLNGRAVGAVATPAGQVCGAGSFDSNGDYIDVSNISSYLKSSASLSFWIKSKQGGNNTAWLAPGIIGVEQRSGVDDIFWGYLDASGRIRIQKGDGRAARSNTVINSDNWHHVILTRDSLTGVVQVFIDGQFENSVTSDKGDVGSSFSSIGRIDKSDSSENFDGQLDELLVFDSVISASEVKSIYDNQSNGRNYDGSTRSCPNPITPLLEYRFEEASWNGSQGEILDNTGNGYHARVNNNSTPRTASPALSGDFGTCGYANQMDGSIQVTGLPLDTLTTGVKTTVTFWMNWDGTNNVMPVGWNRHDIWMVDGSMGFNTWNSDIYGISSRGLANGWHHVAVEFTNGRVTSNRMYIDGVEQTLTRRKGRNPNNNSAFVNSEMRIGGVSNSRSYDFHGSLDEFRVYEGILSTAEVVAIMNEKHSCSSTPVINHYEISSNGQGLTCEPKEVVIKACTNSDYNSCTVSSNQLPALNVNVQGTSISVPVISRDPLEGTGKAYIPYTAEGDVLLSLSTTSLTTVCGNDNSTGPCVLTFADTGFQFTSSINSNGIPTQLSGKPSNVGYNRSILSLQAIKKNTVTGVCESALIGSTPIELSAECIEPTTCKSNVEINSTTITKPNTPVSLDFGDKNDNSAEFIFTSPDAGKVQLHARYNIPVDGALSGDYMKGSSNRFVVRPFGFYIAADGNKKAVDADGLAYKKAGEEFTTSVTAVQWQASDDLDNDGIPDDGSDLSNNNKTPNFDWEVSSTPVVLTHQLKAPSNGSLGSLSGNAITGFSYGTGETKLSWSEVGIISLTANLSSYMNAGPITGTIPYVGRFKPDHFKQTVAENGKLFTTCGAGTMFAYTGQTDALYPNIGAILYDNPPVLEITAYNKQGDITRNYDGDFIKLNDDDVSVVAPTLDTVNNTSLTANIGSGILRQTDLTTLSNGTALPKGVSHYQFYTLDDFVYNRVSGTEITPYTSAFELAVDTISDSDGVDLIPGDGSASTTESASPQGIEIRFGRLVLQNSFGPAVANLTQPLQVEYFNGSNFVVSSDDNCLGYEVAKLVPYDINDLDPGETQSVGVDGSFSDGKTRALQLKAPDAGKTGDIGVRYHLEPNHTWLQYDWSQDNDGLYDENPSAIATFGLFRGNDRVIYRRVIN